MGTDIFVKICIALSEQGRELRGREVGTPLVGLGRTSPDLAVSRGGGRAYRNSISTSSTSLFLLRPHYGMLMLYPNSMIQPRMFFEI